ncbi:hypothetical protein BK004_00035 [bacterium CG10_46_32]|nr:MAG: hypothetical protein BK004_00035 [bacterium CG10_46_32]PIR56512.1 MAG: hypothetical protein COU73_00035 [Parcubacteria group bacterium CG10_big_fil_rev_8_21_14_0_10_46_32]
MSFLKQSKGEITSRDLVITASITLFIAAIMIVAFIILGKQGDKTNQDAENIIKQIQQQAKDEENAAKGLTTPSTEEDNFEPEATYTGTLSSHESGVRITVRTTTSEETIQLAPFTRITLNNKTAAESDLSIGDILRVLVERTRDGTQTATEIAILRSTSPTVPTNVSVPTIQPAPVETRPVSPY